MIQVLDIGAEDPEGRFGVFLARYLLECRCHAIEETVQLPLAVGGALDLLEEGFALAVAVDQILAQVDIDRVGLLPGFAVGLEPDFLLEIDAKALGVVLDLLDLAPVDQPLVVQQVLDLLEERGVAGRVFADLQRHALEQFLVVDVRHKAFHRVGEDAGLVRGSVAPGIGGGRTSCDNVRMTQWSIREGCQTGRLEHAFAGGGSSNSNGKCSSCLSLVRMLCQIRKVFWCLSHHCHLAVCLSDVYGGAFGYTARP